MPASEIIKELRKLKPHQSIKYDLQRNLKGLKNAKASEILEIINLALRNHYPSSIIYQNLSEFEVTTRLTFAKARSVFAELAKDPDRFGDFLKFFEFFEKKTGQEKIDLKAEQRDVQKFFSQDGLAKKIILSPGRTTDELTVFVEFLRQKNALPQLEELLQDVSKELTGEFDDKLHAILKMNILKELNLLSPNFDNDYILKLLFSELPKKQRYFYKHDDFCRDLLKFVKEEPGKFDKNKVEHLLRLAFAQNFFNADNFLNILQALTKGHEADVKEIFIFEVGTSKTAEFPRDAVSKFVIKYELTQKERLSLVRNYCLNKNYKKLRDNLDEIFNIVGLNQEDQEVGEGVEEFFDSLSWDLKFIFAEKLQGKIRELLVKIIDQTKPYEVLKNLVSSNSNLRMAFSYYVGKKAKIDAAEAQDLLHQIADSENHSLRPIELFEEFEKLGVVLTPQMIVRFFEESQSLDSEVLIMDFSLAKERGMISQGSPLILANILAARVRESYWSDKFGESYRDVYIKEFLEDQPKCQFDFEAISRILLRYFEKNGKTRGDEFPDRAERFLDNWGNNLKAYLDYLKSWTDDLAKYRSQIMALFVESANKNPQELNPKALIRAYKVLCDVCGEFIPGEEKKSIPLLSILKKFATQDPEELERLLDLFDRASIANSNYQADEVTQILKIIALNKPSVLQRVCHFLGEKKLEGLYPQLDWATLFILGKSENTDVKKGEFKFEDVGLWLRKLSDSSNGSDLEVIARVLNHYLDVKAELKAEEFATFLKSCLEQPVFALEVIEKLLQQRPDDKELILEELRNKLLIYLETSPEKAAAIYGFLKKNDEKGSKDNITLAQLLSLNSSSVLTDELRKPLLKNIKDYITKNGIRKFFVEGAILGQNPIEKLHAARSAISFELTDVNFNEQIFPTLDWQYSFLPPQPDRRKQWIEFVINSVVDRSDSSTLKLKPPLLVKIGSTEIELVEVKQVVVFSKFFPQLLAEEQVKRLAENQDFITSINAGINYAHGRFYTEAQHDLFERINKFVPQGRDVIKVSQLLEFERLIEAKNKFAVDRPSIPRDVVNSNLYQNLLISSQDLGSFEIFYRNLSPKEKKFLGLKPEELTILSSQEKPSWLKIKLNINLFKEVAGFCKNLDEFRNVVSTAFGLVTQPNCSANLAINLQHVLEEKKYSDPNKCAVSMALFQAAFQVMNSDSDFIGSSHTYEQALKNRGKFFFGETSLALMVGRELFDAHGKGKNISDEDKEKLEKIKDAICSGELLAQEYDEALINLGREVMKKTMPDLYPQHPGTGMHALGLSHVAVNTLQRV